MATARSKANAGKTWTNDNIVKASPGVQTANIANVEVGKLQELKRPLRPRHIQMIAIGGVIGTGLFLGTADNLENAGPAGLLLSYLIMSSLLYSVMVCRLNDYEDLERQLLISCRSHLARW